MKKQISQLQLHCYEMKSRFLCIAWVTHSSYESRSPCIAGVTYAGHLYWRAHICCEKSLCIGGVTYIGHLHGSRIDVVKVDPYALLGSLPQALQGSHICFTSCGKFQISDLAHEGSPKGMQSHCLSHPHEMQKAEVATLTSNARSFKTRRV
jgi:hypothetical protein